MPQRPESSDTACRHSSIARTVARWSAIIALTTALAASTVMWYRSYRTSWHFGVDIIDTNSFYARIALYDSKLFLLWVTRIDLDSKVSPGGRLVDQPTHGPPEPGKPEITRDELFRNLRSEGRSLPFQRVPGYSERPTVVVAGKIKLYKTALANWYQKVATNRLASMRIDKVALPVWLPTLLCAVAVIIVICPRWLRLRKRRNQGLCLTCGYDLRGSHPTCPECGTTTDPLTTGDERPATDDPRAANST